MLTIHFEILWKTSKFKVVFKVKDRIKVEGVLKFDKFMFTLYSEHTGVKDLKLKVSSFADASFKMKMLW